MQIKCLKDNFRKSANMIISNINDKTTTFICHNKYLKEVFDWLKTTDLKNLQVGRYDLNDGIFVKIQEYNTK